MKRALLLLVVLALIGWMILEFDTVVILFRSLWRWIIRAAKFLRKFLFRIIKSVIRKRFLRPIWAALGLLWLGRYLTKKFKSKWGEKLTSCWGSTKDFWKRLPWSLRAAIIAGFLVVGFLLGLGLWLIPFGIPFAEKLAIKLQIIFANTGLQKLTRRLKSRAMKAYRWIKPYPPITQLRIARIWLLKRDRALSRWADKKFGKDS
jgi:hypothetical protein